MPGLGLSAFLSRTMSTRTTRTRTQTNNYLRPALAFIALVMSADLLPTTLVIQAKQSITGVCLCLCVRAITVELNDI